MIPVPNYKEICEKVEKQIREAGVETLPDMLRAVGLDPVRDIFAQDWSYTNNWGTEDVTGWDFRCADLTGADLSTLTNLDKARFSNKTRLDGVILPEGITTEILLR